MVSTDFSRQRRLNGIERLYGAPVLHRFQNAHVCVVGLGGVGSWAVEALARSGIGHLTLIDLDNVAESNINRQLHALTENLGKAKTRALRERIASIQPQCVITEIEDFITADNIPEYFATPFDFVIDAIDQMRVKAALADYCVRHKQPFAVSGGAGGQRHPEQIRIADLRDVSHDKLLANMRYALRKQYAFPRDLGKKMRIPCVYSTETVTPPPQDAACAQAPQGLSCAGYGAVMTVTATFGLFLANLALEHLAQDAA